MTNTQEAFEKAYDLAWENNKYEGEDAWEVDDRKMCLEVWQANQAHNDAVIAELVEALEDIKSKTYQPQALIALHAMNDINKIATSLIAKHKKV